MKERSLKTVAIVLVLLALLAMQAGAATLIGKWNFEGSDTAAQMANSAPGYTWESSVPDTGDRTPTFANGKMTCNACQATDGTWTTQALNSTLVTPATGSVPSTSHTTILWVSIDKLGDDDDYSFMFRCGNPTYGPLIDWCQGPAATGQRQFDLRAGQEWLRPYSWTNTIPRNYVEQQGPEIQAGKMIKLVQVAILDDSDLQDTYSKVYFYWDNYDGQGLRPYGSRIELSEAGAPMLGNAGDEVWFFPGANSLTADTIDFTFEEARVYTGAMTQAEADAVTYDGQPKLVGKWTFDWSNASGPMANKAPGYNWNPMVATGQTANTVSLENGQLKLIRWPEGGAYRQPGASATLATDLGLANYFKEQTQVVWVKWSDLDANHSEWLTSLRKACNPPFGATTNERPECTLWFNTDASNANWTDRHQGETLDTNNVLTISGNTTTLGSTTKPLANTITKVAYVIKADPDSPGNYFAYIYADFNDGLGVRTIGTPSRVWGSQLNDFGQASAPCTIDANQDTSLHTDSFTILPYCPAVPNGAGSISIEEAQLYAGAMDPVTIGKLDYSHSGAPKLIGKWTFDYSNQTSPSASKAAGVLWDPIVTTDSGSTIADGKLILPKGANGQVGARAKLKTDLGASGYFKEWTVVSWLKWENFTSPEFISTVSLMKMDSTGATRAGSQNCWVNDTWAVRPVWENPDCTVNGNDHYGFAKLDTDPYPATDKFIKMAWVCRQIDDANFEIKPYWDKGAGLVPASNGSAIIAANKMYFYGQSGSANISSSCTGTRFDELDFPGFPWNSGTGAGNMIYDEVQLYSGAMTTDQINALAATNGPTDVTGTMIGKWNFDGADTTEMLSNKVPDVTWAKPIFHNGDNSYTVANGKLTLERYQDGSTWQQNGVSWPLHTDLMATRGSYFQNFSMVLWMKYSDVDPGTSQWIAGPWKTGSQIGNPYQTIWFNNTRTDSTFWEARGGGHYLNGSGILSWSDCDSALVTDADLYTNQPAGYTPSLKFQMPANQLFKLAYVFHPSWADPWEGRHRGDIYIDLLDGQGLKLIGTTDRMWGSNISWFGQYMAPNTVDPTQDTGMLSDTFDIFYFCPGVPAKAGYVEIEEARLYSDTLTQSDLAGLKYDGQVPPVVNQVVGASNKAVLDSIMTTAAPKYDWVLWGRVHVVDENTFTIDDGSGVFITVNATGHGLEGTPYVSVKGTLNLSGSTPVLNAKTITPR
ncbi:MAG: hypothetical protein ABFD54_15225 [Armatimonadota bacterium]|nr:hypothetical protein [bacterium]